MKIYHFKNEQVALISEGAPNQITSTMNVQGTGGNIEDINVKLDVNHSYTNDLEILLKSPDGTSVLLVSGAGGSGDDFDETTFDDDASISINNGSAPFRGVFQPIESLGKFNGSNANGDWRLEVLDQAFQDGGALNKWELEMVTDEPVQNTGPFLFHNQTPTTISSAGIDTIESQINVQGLGDINVETICATIDIDHTFTQDLKISLVSPDGKEVVLVDREGGGSDNFHDTTFDDAAAEPITGASAPFTGTFRPEGKLSDFRGISPAGVWKLIVNDQANLDGGVLKSWTIAIKSDDTPQPSRPFKIEVRFVGDPNGLSPSQKAIFQTAADRWSEIIVGNLPAINTDLGVVDDLVIDAEGKNIDGVGGTLGQAGPTKLRPGSLLPARGIMQFDSADLQKMEDDGSLTGVIIHEMGHVLGIGTLWSSLGLIQGSGTNNPEFKGSNAMQEYSTLKNTPNPGFVPIANTGGQGTREGHWRESVFDTELMTGYVDVGQMPLSRLTIASLQDIGYQVDYNKANPFILPFALLSLEMLGAKQPHQCLVTSPDIEILPEENLVV